jgi:putative addiction module component (TIGR02574 family)
LQETDIEFFARKKFLSALGRLGGWYMTAQVAHILEEARKLSPIERAELIEGLFGSFDNQHNSLVEEAWAKEAMHRSEEIDKGNRIVYSLDSVITDLASGKI